MEPHCIKHADKTDCESGKVVAKPELTTRFVVVSQFFAFVVVVVDYREIVHSAGSQKAHVGDETGHGASCVCAARKPKKEEFVAWFVVLC